MALEEGSVLYLEKDRLFFYDGSKVIKLDFVPQVVRDIDVINEDSLRSMIFQFIDGGKIQTSTFLFVLSESVLFSEETNEKDISKLTAEFQNFTDLVPFDSVLSKFYQVDQGVRMVATNAQLVSVISASFEQKGFKSDGVVPAIIFGQFGVRSGFDSDTAHYMLQNQQMALGKSMLETLAPTAPTSVFKVTKTGPNKMLPYLIVGFAVAIIGLLALIFLKK